MLVVFSSDRFLKTAAKLPANQQEKLADLLETLRKNPFDPQLHTKHLTGKLSGLYSFRITRDWRVIFRFLSPQEILLVNVDHRKDVYR